MSNVLKLVLNGLTASSFNHDKKLILTFTLNNLLRELFSIIILIVTLLGFPLTSSVYAASSEEMIDALGIPPALVIDHNLFIISDQGGSNTILSGEGATSAFLQSNSVLISNGLASDKGLGDTDWGNDGKYDSTTFSVNLSVPPGAKTLVFRTRFTSSEYDPDSNYNNDRAALNIAWTPCIGIGCITAPVDVVKVSGSPDITSPFILRSINVADLDTVAVTFYVRDENNGNKDSAIEIMDFHFSEEAPVSPALINEELLPEDVKMSAGTYKYEKSLIYVPGVGLPLDFKVYYNSKQTWSKTFGRKWSHSYEWSLAELDNGLIHIRGGDGGSVYFELEGNAYKNFHGSFLGSFETSWSGVDGSVVKNINGSYSYTDRDQNNYQFSASGLLLSIADLNGNEQTFTYWPNNSLKLINDTKGGMLELFYTNNQTVLVSMIYTDSAGGLHPQIEFSYFLQNETINDVLYEYWDLAYIRDFSSELTEFTYDSKGNMLTGMDADGITFIDNTYAGEIVVSQSDALGATDSYRFFTDTLEHTNRLGLVSTTSFNTQDRPIRKKDAGDNIWTYDYNENGNLIKETDPLGYVTTMTYSDSGNQLSRTDSIGNTTQQTFTDQNNLSSVTDPDGNTTTYNYDTAGNLLQETNPLGYITQYTVDSFGQIIETINQRGNVSNYVFLSTGDLVQETDPLGNSVQYSYDGMGWLSTLTDERGNTSLYTYDQMGQLLSSTDPLGYETSRTYNARGQVLSLTKANNAVTGYEYDANGKVIKLIDSLGNILTSDYDAMEQLISLTDPMGRVTAFDYDEIGQLVSVIDPLAGTVRATYDAAGHRTGITDPNGNATQYNLDALGHIISETDPLGNTLKNTYDARGLLASSENAKGELISYTYDAAGQLIQSDLPGYSNFYTLDENGNRINTVSEDGATITASIDQMDQLLSRMDPFGNTIQYKYDPSGNLSELAYSDGKKVLYQYDANDRLISLTDWDGNTTVYTYDSVGNLLTTSHADGSIISNSYNIASQLISTRTTSSSGSTIFEASYSYNDVGMLVSTNAMLPLEPGLDPGTAKFSYDAANQITQMNDQPFTYDENGNMSSGVIGGSMQTMQYDGLGRLKTIGQDSYKYDSEGLRIQSNIGGKTVRYVQDPNAPYSRLLEEHDENGNITARYVYGVGLISREDSSGKRNTYHYDSRGSTVALTDSTGLTTDRYAYDPYGKVVGRTGSTINPFTYNARDGVFDDGNGLYFMRARYYEPTLMRFVQKDQTFSGNLMDTQSLNRHAYAKGNPVQYVDPNGDIIVTTIVVGFTIGVLTEIAFDWATGEFNPLTDDWGAYFESNATDLLVAGVLGATGGVLANLSKIKRLKKIKDFYKKAGMSMKAFKQWAKVNKLIKFGSKGAAAAAAVGGYLKELGKSLVKKTVAEVTHIKEIVVDGVVEGVEAAADFVSDAAGGVKDFFGF